MDPNAEGGPPKADLEVIEAEVEFEASDAPPQPASTSPFPPYIPPNPFSSSSIFRNAYSRPQPRASSSGAQGTTGNEARADSEGLGSASASFEEMEEVRKANEAEFERRLKGEYMAAQQRLGQVVSDNMDRPMRLSSIRLSPSPPISRSSFLNSLLSPFITPSTSPFIPSWLNPAPPPPRTLHEILFSTRALVAHLDRFGVYNMEESAVRLETKQGGDPDEVELVLGLKERGRFFLKAGTEVGGNEGGGNITARLRNALGGGETLEGQASIGTKTKSAYSASLSTPVLCSPLLAFALSAFSFDRDNTAFASHREQAQGARAKLSAIAPWGAHDLTYEYIQREITGLLPKASVSIRELARPSTKSSLTHTWLSDTRDDPYLGTSGRMLKLTHEYAGLPGSSTSAHFLKSVTQSHLSRALYEGSNVTFSIASLTSLLYPLSPRSSPTELPDRLFLGGPNSVRGWKVGGMGLHDSHDSLGGEMAWGMGLSVFAPLWPGKEAWPARLHGFLNAGKISSYNRDQPFSENIAKMYNKPNLSAGLGLMYRLDPIRIEVNFSMPLVGRKGERMSRGFGVGVGLEFLNEVDWVQEKRVGWRK